MFQKLLSLLDSTDADLTVPLSTEILQLKKGDVITATGVVENYIYYLQSGAVKVSYFHEIKEHILDFWFEGDYFTSYISFIQRSPSITQITALCDTIVERTSYEQLQNIYKNTPFGNEVGRKMAERMYIHKTLREIELISLNAEQRYLKLLHESKQLLQEVSVKDIASYLGIQPESLSRIRKKISS